MPIEGPFWDGGYVLTCQNGSAVTCFHPAEFDFDLRTYYFYWFGYMCENCFCKEGDEPSESELIIFYDHYIKMLSHEQEVLRRLGEEYDEDLFQELMLECMKEMYEKCLFSHIDLVL